MVVNKWNKITYLVEMMKWGVEVCDRKLRTKTFHTCFVGSEAVDWIMKALKMETREDAVDFAQMLVDRSVFHHVNYLETFADKPLAFYRFYQVQFRDVSERCSCVQRGHHCLLADGRQDDKKYPTVTSATRTTAFQKANATMDEFVRTQEKLAGILTASPDAPLE